MGLVPILAQLADRCFTGFHLIGFFTGIGQALWITSLNVKYRDFRYVISFIVQICLYVSPVSEALERMWARRHDLQQIGLAAAAHIRRSIPRDPIGVFVDDLRRNAHGATVAEHYVKPLVAVKE